MLGFLKKIFDYNEKQLSRLQKKVDEISLLEEKARKLENNEFVKETQKIKGQIKSEEKDLNDILPWTFALAREAARRVLENVIMTFSLWPVLLFMKER